MPILGQTPMPKLYKWNKYNAQTNYTYYWQRYGVKTINQYSGNSVSAGQKQFTHTGFFYVFYHNQIQGIDENGCYIISDWYVEQRPTSNSGAMFVLQDPGKYPPTEYYEYLYGNSLIAVNVYQPQITGTSQVMDSSSVIGEISSANRSAYPDDGIADGVYYKYSRESSSQSQGATHYGQVSSFKENTYPTNGLHTDGYWYVRV